MYKKFSQGLFDLNDRSARVAVGAFLESQDILVAENTDKYGPDLIVYAEGKPDTYVEVEVKQAWKGGEYFPFPTINLPERKGKYLQLGLAIEYWILSKDLHWAMIIPGNVIELKFLKEVPNRLLATGEKFFQVPVELCNIVRLT